jgi:hypothetical protein
MLFSIACYFKPGGAAGTARTAAEFGDHLQQPSLRIPLGGALRNDDGEEVGFMVLLEAPSFVEARHFLDESPNVSADLYDRVEVSQLDLEVGRLP